jgi:hypothetical protein
MWPPYFSDIPHPRTFLALAYIVYFDYIFILKLPLNSLDGVENEAMIA